MDIQIEGIETEEWSIEDNKRQSLFLRPIQNLFN